MINSIPALPVRTQTTVPFCFGFFMSPAGINGFRVVFPPNELSLVVHVRIITQKYETIFVHSNLDVSGACTRGTFPAVDSQLSTSWILSFFIYQIKTNSCKSIDSADKLVNLDQAASLKPGENFLKSALYMWSHGGWPGGVWAATGSVGRDGQPTPASLTASTRRR